MKPSKYKGRWRCMVRGTWSPTGQRKAEYFDTREQAAKFCQEIKRLGISYYNGTSAQPTPKLNQRQLEGWQATIEFWASELGFDRSHIPLALQQYKATQLNVKQASIEEAVEAFHAWRLRDPAVKSDATRKADKIYLKKLVAHFAGRPLATIIEQDIHGFFQALVRNHRTVYKTVRKFFGWARQNNYCKVDPMENVKPVGEFGVNNEYYSVEDFGRMLRIAAGQEPLPGAGFSSRFVQLLPWLVLSGFGGLRTCEALRVNGRDAVRWTDLHLDADIPQIEIRSTVAKAGRRRFIDAPYAIEAIKAWLVDFYPTLTTLEEFISPLGEGALGELKKEFTLATGIEFPENGLRNSFATYALAYDNKAGAGAVAEQMGNSEKVLKKHYASALPRGTGAKWFSLRPEERNNEGVTVEIAA